MIKIRYIYINLVCYIMVDCIKVRVGVKRRDYMVIQDVFRVGSIGFVVL